MKMKKMRNLLFLMILGSLLVGCAMTPMVNTVMNPDVPRADHAVLNVPSTVRSMTINGDRVRAGAVGFVDGSVGRREPMIVLPPGKHTIRAMYSHYTEVGDRAIVTTSDGYITVEHTFQAGKRYNFITSESNNRVAFRIVEETDTSEKWVTRANDRISRVRYPSRVALSITNSVPISNALSAAPTQFEGRWTYQYGALNYTYVFTGNRYSIATRIVGANTINRQSNGIFELTDSVITLTPLQRDFENIARPRPEVYGYTRTADQIILTHGRRTVATLARQPSESEGD
jgi:hypothetical protein